MIEPTLKAKILKHLEDPLCPSKEAELGEAATLVEFPTKAEKARGGLSPKGEVLATLDVDIAKAVEAHREATRVKIHAVTGTCALFVVSKSKEISPEEKKALICGISITQNGKADRIKTTRKNGKLLTPEFKEMMAALYRATKLTLPTVAKTVAAAASLQKMEEKLEKAMYENIAEMA